VSVSGLATLTVSSLVPSCGGATRGSVEGIVSGVFKISVVEWFPTTLASPYCVHKEEVGYGTR
jgi:hypothetical protein